MERRKHQSQPRQENKIPTANLPLGASLAYDRLILSELIQDLVPGRR